MTINDVFSDTFKAIRKTISPEVRKRVDFSLPSMPMVEACRADGFDFFEPFIAEGLLTVEQMHHACQRYHLGKTRNGRPIFWMIDEMLTPLDAHIGTDAWLSTLLKAREPLLAPWQVTHCLFGLHLCQSKDPCQSVQSVAVVESEKSAILLSELFPEALWMAYATIGHFSPELFAPLQGHTVILYPRTDPVGDYYLASLELADQVRRLYHLDISVDSTLEHHATPEQKAAKIDLVDFL